ncbi:MAG: GntR family transcriptional regulator [Gammaproteobacteria bacterium]|nr:GntR family transcriptional regulator [Gammaproteobacteria bacterium]
MLSTDKGSISLYMQIKELLVARIGRGDWLPGDAIPSEIQLAQDLGVSQGTVRKAITELVEKNVLTRKQGRGTFVSTHDQERALFHFFHIAADDGQKALPQSSVLHLRRKAASRAEAAKLHLPGGSRVINIERIRRFDERPTILENIVLPAELFEGLGLDGEGNLPNTLYELYQREYGITIHRASECLKAVGASEREATLLEVAPGAALLQIERIALTLEDTPVELRTSRCNTAHHFYENTIF